MNCEVNVSPGVSGSFWACQFSLAVVFVYLRFREPNKKKKKTDLRETSAGNSRVPVNFGFSSDLTVRRF